MKDYYIASCSNGKDSIAMILKILELNMPLNEVVFYDTGVEFKPIYNNWDKLKGILNKKNIKTTTLHPKKSFLYNMLDKEVNCIDGSKQKGYKWCGRIARWGTTNKVRTLNKYCENLNALCYVGITYNEKERAGRFDKDYKIAPMIDWKMTEKQALEYCYKNDFNWIENGIDLYEIMDRISCWCCCNHNQYELYGLYTHFYDKYWKWIKELQKQIDIPYKKTYTIFKLEKRFEDGFVPKRARVKINNDNLPLIKLIDKEQ